MRKLFIFLYCCLVLAACSTPFKIIKYDEQKNDLYSNNNLIEFIKLNNAPKIVLRAADFDDIYRTDLSRKKNLNYLFGIMESELMRQGFNIKDRNTFDEIISKTNSVELLKKELSDADMILEVVNLEDKILYTTNKVTLLGKTKLKEERQSRQYQSIGAIVEYRLILIKTNEIAGSYRFYYQPCPHGCPVDDFKLTNKDKNIQMNKTAPEDAVKQFISTSIKELSYFLLQNKSHGPEKN